MTPSQLDCRKHELPYVEGIRQLRPNGTRSAYGRGLSRQRFPRTCGGACFSIIQYRKLGSEFGKDHMSKKLRNEPQRFGAEDPWETILAKVAAGRSCRYHSGDHFLHPKSAVRLHQNRRLDIENSPGGFDWFSVLLHGLWSGIDWHLPQDSE